MKYGIGGGKRRKGEVEGRRGIEGDRGDRGKGYVEEGRGREGE